MKLIHCARLLHWARYSEVLKGSLPRYQQCYQLESIKEDHRTSLRACCERIDTLSLIDPPAALSEEIQPQDRSDDPMWLIVHAGSSNEIMELVHFALDIATIEKSSPRLLVLSPHRPEELSPEIDHARVYPVHSWFTHADRIFSACGFNTVRQLSAYRVKHRFIPFPRRFDDQFARAAAIRSGLWDGVKDVVNVADQE